MQEQTSYNVIVALQVGSDPYDYMSHSATTQDHSHYPNQRVNFAECDCLCSYLCKWKLWASGRTWSFAKGGCSRYCSEPLVPLDLPRVRAVLVVASDWTPSFLILGSTPTHKLKTLSTKVSGPRSSEFIQSPIQKKYKIRSQALFD